MSWKRELSMFQQHLSWIFSIGSECHWHRMKWHSSWSWWRQKPRTISYTLTVCSYCWWERIMSIWWTVRQRDNMHPPPRLTLVDLFTTATTAITIMPRPIQRVKPTVAVRQQPPTATWLILRGNYRTCIDTTCDTINNLIYGDTLPITSSNSLTETFQTKKEKTWGV